MKNDGMNDGFRQSMSWLHTWAGLSVCWVLLLVFMAGTASYYKDEITFWMQPELHGAAMAPTPISSADAAALAVATLAERAPQATRWLIDLPGERHPLLRLRWTQPANPGENQTGRRGQRHTLFLDPASGLETAKPRASRGGEFLYRLHFDLHYLPALWARWLVGFCAMFMLVAIISGVITHKHIFKDFFTFRPRKGSRSWLDAHNALAVLALPFHLMITYTGLVTLMLMFMPAPGKVMYPDGAFGALLFPAQAPRIAPAGIAMPMTDLAPLLARANRAWSAGVQLESAAGPIGQIGKIRIDHPGDANAQVTLVRRSGRQLSNTEPSMTFNAIDGTLIASDNPVSTASATFRSFYGLHVAHFADPLLRALFFLCGLAGCAMVATGALLWAVKERKKCAKALANGASIGFGLRLVEALNIGAIAGLPIAFGAYFWGNRLLPVALPERIAAEAGCFFGAWLLAAALAQISPTRSMWRWQLGLGGALLAAIPLLNALTTNTHLGQSLRHGSSLHAVAAFDLVTLALGLLLAGAAWSLRRRSAP
jgi:uncharacterized iron-regulated membrane protein